MGRLILFLLRALVWGYSIQPLGLQRLWGRGLGLMLRAIRLRAPIVHQNLALAYPAAASGHHDQLYRESYAHLGNLVLEILMLLGPQKTLRQYVTRHSELLGLDHWIAAKNQGKGVIFLASHVGNWEIMAATGAVQAGIDILLVTKHLKPEWLHQAVEKGRASCGVRATYEPRTLRDVLGHLKRNGTVGFVLDQYAGAPIGVRVPVFGVPVGTTTAIATLARRTGAVVLSVVNYRVPGGGWKVEIRPPVAWVASDSPAYELADNTARYAAEVERDIYAHPSQWMWIHRRFKGDLGPLRAGEWGEGRART